MKGTGSIIIFIVVLCCMYFVYLYLDSLFGNKKDGKMPYHKKFILTNSEYKFYSSFKPIMDTKNYIICPKVGLKDLFEVNAGTKERQKYFYKISQKHIDFLVCDSKLVPLFAIELDDKSHKRADVKERDKFKDVLFEKCGLPLYRVPTTDTYSERYIGTYIPDLFEKVSYVETKI